MALFVSDLLEKVVKSPKNKVLAFLLHILCCAWVPAAVYFIIVFIIYGFGPNMLGQSLGIFAGFTIMAIMYKVFDIKEKG